MNIIRRKDEGASDWGVRAGFGLRQQSLRACLFYCLQEAEAVSITNETSALTHTLLLTHNPIKLFCHPPDPANASAAGAAATVEGPSPGEGANASRAS